jgi:hypothetical protein
LRIADRALSSGHAWARSRAGLFDIVQLAKPRVMFPCNAIHVRNAHDVINAGKDIYACRHPSRRVTYGHAPQDVGRRRCSFFSSADLDLILRSLVPAGTRRLEGWPHTGTVTYGIYAQGREKFRPRFNALIIGDNNSPLLTISRAGTDTSKLSSMRTTTPMGEDRINDGKRHLCAETSSMAKTTSMRGPKNQ